MNVFQPFVATASMLGVTAPNIEGYLRALRYDGANRTARPTPTVVLRFDDGVDEQANAITVADAKEVPICIAAITSRVGLEGYLSYAELLAAQTSGHEILNHSKNHYYGDYDITDLLDPTNETYYSVANAIDEVKGSYDILKANGLNAPCYVNPGHATDWRTQELLHTYCRCAVSAGLSPYYCERNINTYKLNSYNASNEFQGLESLSTYLTDIIDEFYALWTGDTDGRLLIIYGHEVEGDGITAMGTLIDYIQAKGDIEILTLSQAMDKHAPTFESGNAADGGRGFSVAPDGSVRGGEGHFTGEIKIWNPAGPFEHYVGMSYEGADLVLYPHVPATDYVHVNAKGLRPYEDRGTLPCSLGYYGHEFDEMWAWKYTCRAYYGDKLRLTSSYSYATISSSPKEVNISIPAKAKVVGIRAKVATAIEGASDWSLEFRDGLDATIDSGLSCDVDTEHFWFYDPAGDSSNRVATSEETDINVIASGATAGVVQIEAWYWEFET